VGLTREGPRTGSTSISIRSLAQAVMQLFTARDDERLWAGAIAMMRHRFGGHPYRPDEDIRRERREGRIGDFPTEYVRRDPQST
jgi:hypothetical protein